MLGIRNYNTKCIYDYTVSTKNAVEITKLKKGEKASIVSDTMFKTMFQNKNRIKYSVKLLSYILDISYEELINNIKLYKNDVDKEYKSDKSERCDYVAEIEDSYVNIEVNNNSSCETMERNIEYAFNIYKNSIKEGSDYEYTNIVQVNLNNFSFVGNDKIIDIYGVQNKDGLLLTDKIIIIQIYIPNIRKKWYTKKEEINEMERYILTLVEPDIDTAKEIGIGDEIMEEYVDESIKVCKEKTFGESYDKEWALKDEWRRTGLHEGIQQGIQQGSLEKAKEIANNLLKLNLSLEDISKATGLKIQDIQNLK